MQQHTEKHYHVSVFASEVLVGEAHFGELEDALIDFVKLSNSMFGSTDDKDTRISLEECYEALQYNPKALFVGWGMMRVTLIKCPGGCAPPTMN